MIEPERDPGLFPPGGSGDQSGRGLKMQEIVFTPEMNQYLEANLHPFQYAASLEMQDLLQDRQAGQAPIVLTGLSGSGKSYTVDKMNEALARYGSDEDTRIASCDATEFISGSSGVRVDQALLGAFVVTSTPLGTKNLEEAGLAFREVPFVEPILRGTMVANVKTVFDNHYALLLTGLPPSNAAFREIAAEYAADKDADKLLEHIFDYIEYNFGKDVTPDMYRYMRREIVDQYKEREDRRQTIGDIVGYTNNQIARYNSTNPKELLHEAAISRASMDLWAKLLEVDAYGAPSVNILATEMNEEQERLLRQQLFPEQQPGFEGYTNFDGVLAHIGGRKHDYSLRDSQSNHWAKVMLPGFAGGTLEDMDFRTDYNAFSSYFVARFMDHGPTQLDTIAHQVITAEALLQTAKIPYTTRISVGRGFDECEYSVDSEGNVKVL